MISELRSSLYELKEELHRILGYWINFAVDENNGGFYGSVDENNIADVNAPKGVVLNARILWAFSAAYNHTKNIAYLTIAERAFDYILAHFKDQQYGGVYWSVDAHGQMLDGKKQIYGLAFVIYGMSEYYGATKNTTALEFAISLYECIEKHSYDANRKGYYEAFSREWKSTDNLRLSAKDANEKKTANTHLHVIEAYANLYKVYPIDSIKSKIKELLQLFDLHFIHPETGHLRLFFDEQWKEKPDVISYGHDIEAAWLLLQCAEIIGDGQWMYRYRQLAILIADAATEGVDKDGGLWYEYDPAVNHLVEEKHWWPQAEAMVGFLNAYQLSGNEKYAYLFLANWNFTKKHLLAENGEWHWGINADGSVMRGFDKAGFWKCPYHNTRACIELEKRVNNILQTTNALQPYKI